MNSFTARVATPEDAKAVEQLLKASYPALMAPSYAPALLEPVLARITRANPALLQSGTFYLVESPAGEVVGCGGWTLAPPDTAFTGQTNVVAHLRHFATHPRWTGLGVGRTIYSLCRANAFEAPARVLEVCSSLNGEGFYAAMGFERVRDVTVPIAPQLAFPGVLMRCRI